MVIVRVSKRVWQRTTYVGLVLAGALIFLVGMMMPRTNSSISGLGNDIAHADVPPLGCSTSCTGCVEGSCGCGSPVEISDGEPDACCDCSEGS